MKIRTNFVSNSSSSSFIIGYGIVRDRAKLEKILEENGFPVGTYEVKIKPKGQSFTDNYEDSNVICGGNNTSLTMAENITKKGDVLIVCVLNDEGDYPFCIYDANGDFYEYDYSIADHVNYFNRQQQALIGILSDKKLLKNGEVLWGAERNG